MIAIPQPLQSFITLFISFSIIDVTKFTILRTSSLAFIYEETLKIVNLVTSIIESEINKVING